MTLLDDKCNTQPLTATAATHPVHPGAADLTVLHVHMLRPPFATVRPTHKSARRAHSN